MSRTLNSSVIGTQGLVYSSPTHRNLVRTNYWLDSVVNRSMSDVYRGVSVGVADMPAFASEKGLGSPIALADTSTFVAGSACVFRVNLNNLNQFPDCYRFDSLEEFEVRYPVHFSIGSLVKLTLPSSAILQLLNGNAAFKLLCDTDYLPCGLEALGSGIIGFMEFEFFKASCCPSGTFICKALQFPSPFAYSPLLMADFPAQVELPEYPSVLKDRYGCEVRRTHIHTEDTLPSNWLWEILLENGLDNPRAILFKEHDRFERITFHKEEIKSLPSTIFSDGQSETLTFYESDDKYRISSNTFSKFVVIFHEPDSDFSKFNIKHPLFLAPDLTPCSLDNLGWETSFLSNGGIGYAV